LVPHRHFGCTAGVGEHGAGVSAQHDLRRVSESPVIPIAFNRHRAPGPATQAPSQHARVAATFTPGHPAGPRFTTPRSTNTATTTQIGLATWVLAGPNASGLDWHETGGGRTQSALYGIWTVGTFTRDGATVLPLTTQLYRWRRLIIDNPDTLSYQQMDDKLITSPAIIDARTITLPEAKPPTTLTINRPHPTS
jgi:hypothetical protein